MTKKQMMEFLARYVDDEVIDEYELINCMRAIDAARERVMEEIEESQYATGLYAFQDAIDVRRREQ